MEKNKIIGGILYGVGFIGYVTFLSVLHKYGTDVYLYGIGASLGTMLFTIGINLLHK